MSRLLANSACRAQGTGARPSCPPPSSVVGTRLVPGTLLLLTLFLPIGCTSLSRADKDSIRDSVKALLEAQVSAWNAGDIEAFMQTYWPSEELRFASGGTLKRGWQATLDRYRTAYPDKAAMGELTFEVLDIDVVARDAAVVFGAWHLERARDELSGLYTLLVREIDGQWLIVHDHTSRTK